MCRVSVCQFLVPTSFTELCLQCNAYASVYCCILLQHLKRLKLESMGIHTIAKRKPRLEVLLQQLIVRAFQHLHQRPVDLLLCRGFGFGNYTMRSRITLNIKHFAHKALEVQQATYLGHKDILIFFRGCLFCFDFVEKHVG